MHDSIDRSDVRPQGRAGRLVRVAMVFALAVALAACSSPGGEGTPEPEPGPTTIADYVVPGAEVAQVTRVSGRIEGYLAPALAPAAVTTSFVGLGAVTSCVGDGDTVECTYSPGRPWIPAPIEADGSFAIDLPASPDLGEDLFTLELCGAPLEVAMNGVIVAHDGALGDVGVEPLAQYARAWFTEDSVIPPNALFPDPSVVVVYGYAPSPRVARCVDTVESGDPEQPGTSIDVDVDVRPGWNVMTWVTRSESGELTVYLRSGEPNAEVPWVMIEESAP
jgi:hypothetical protein